MTLPIHRHQAADFTMAGKEKRFQKSTQSAYFCGLYWYEVTAPWETDHTDCHLIQRGFLRNKTATYVLDSYSAHFAYSNNIQKRQQVFQNSRRISTTTARDYHLKQFTQYPYRVPVSNSLLSLLNSTSALEVLLNVFLKGFCYINYILWQLPLD